MYSWRLSKKRLWKNITWIFDGKTRKLGAKCLLICVNIIVYGKSWFVEASNKGIKYTDYPEGDAPFFLCKELEKYFLKNTIGSYKEPKGYFVAEKNPELFEEYDSKFPKKEKLKWRENYFW